MHELLISGICFVATFLLAFILILLIDKKKIKKRKNMDIMEVNYLVGKFNLSPAKIVYKKLIRIIALTNAFIIAFVATIIYLVPLKLFWQLSIGFVLLMILIYALYEIIGRKLQQKWGKK